MDIFSEIKNTFRQGSLTTRLIYVNLSVFLVLRILLVLFSLFNVDVPLVYWLALPSDVASVLMRPWTLFTYMFLHYNFIHILFNLLWLYWFGKIFLGYFDEKKMLGLYILGGFTGGILYIAAYNIFPAFETVTASGMLLGASASIISIVIATAVYAPNLSLHLFPISAFFGPIKIIWIAIASIIIYIIGIGGSNAGGNIAHLGGAIWGYLYIMQLKKGNDISAKFNFWVYHFFESAKKIFSKKNRMHVSYKRNETQRMTDLQYNKKKKAEQESINHVLDKIAKSGYDSLSKEEKEMLFRMGNRNGKPN
jgi:membrane associated rhomboid family serine protease